MQMRKMDFLKSLWWISELLTKFKFKQLKNVVTGHFEMVVTLFQDTWFRSHAKDVFTSKILSIWSVKYLKWTFIKIPIIPV